MRRLSVVAIVALSTCRSPGTEQLLRSTAAGIDHLATELDETRDAAGARTITAAERVSVAIERSDAERAVALAVAIVALVLNLALATVIEIRFAALRARDSRRSAGG